MYDKITNQYHYKEYEYGWLEAGGLLKYKGPEREEAKFFSMLTSAMLLSSSRFEHYYDTDQKDWKRDCFIIPKEDEEIVKITIEAYNNNYDDRVANLKAAFEEKQLGKIQPSRTAKKVSGSLEGHQSILSETT